MKNYEIKLKIALDDNGYILKNNWIYDAIAEQLENGEIIEYFKIREIESENLEWAPYILRARKLNASR